MELHERPIRDLAAAVNARAVSAREVVGHFLARIDAVNPAINAFVAVDGARALADAAALDEHIAAGGHGGALAGVPIGVKDLEDAIGFRTSHGSALYNGSPIATADTAEVARLRAAGAIVLGKTNTPEFGCKADTDNRVFGATLNPIDHRRSAGGSSGGSAAAVAAGLVPMATGSDGGGSIRIPSSMCGLPGMKCTPGRVPVGGPVAPSWGHLSARGPMARTVDDIAYCLDVVVGPEPTDALSLPAPLAPWAPQLRAVGRRRVGWSPTLGYAEVDAEVAAVCADAVRRLADSLDIELVEIPVVFDTDPVRLFLALSGVGNLLGVEEHRDRFDELDPVVLSAALWAESRLTGADLARAYAGCHHLGLRLAEVFRDVDVLLCPTIASPVPLQGADGVVNGHSTAAWVRFTYPFNLSRSPAGTIPAGRDAAGMPVGLQVVGPQHGDLAVLQFLAAAESVLG